MAGGAQAALQMGCTEVEALGMPLGRDFSRVDLDAGFGMHAISMARAGASVVAIDASAPS
jgi:2-polyprenyl-3-methyl-5-hydroxy-6-metoxy-1,4-benzoquinol methylase